jgi:hypothetical protein
MSIFVVVQQNASGPKGSLAEAITSTGLPSYQLRDGVWLLSNEGTARETSEKIGIAEGETGTAVVAEVGSYFGRANPAIWTWIKKNWGGQPLG